MEYNEFLSTRGRPLSEMNPGSDEVALTPADAGEALRLLLNTSTPVLGGDVLTEKDDKLCYAYQSWGTSYHYLNWHCDPKSGETQSQYAQRCYDLAKAAIQKALVVAEELKKPCFIVLVT